MGFTFGTLMSEYYNEEHNRRCEIYHDSSNKFITLKMYKDGEYYTSRLVHSSMDIAEELAEDYVETGKL